MNNNFVIIERKALMKWLGIVTAYFICGYLTRSYFSYFTILVFFYLYIRKSYASQYYLTVLWIFIHRYFMGIRLLESNPIVTTGTTFFALFMIFVYLNNVDSLLKEKLTRRLVFLHVLLGIWLLMSFLLNKYNILRIPRMFDYFLLFVALLVSDLKTSFYYNIVNLIYAIALFQIPIAFAQYLKVLPAPYLSVTGNTVNTEQWESGLDDAACGTFGSAASPDLSLFLSVMAIVLVINFIHTKKLFLLVFALILLLQYTIVDSKTVLFVAAIISFFTFIWNSKIRKGLIEAINVKIVILLVTFFTVSSFAIINYYKKGFGDTEERQFEKTTYVVSRSVTMVTTHFSEWGKIKGFKYAYETQNRKNGIMANIFGAGLGDFHFMDQGMAWRRKTNSSFFINGFFNNFVDTNSALIIILYNTGIIGLLTISFIYFSLYKGFSKLYNKAAIFHTVNPLVRPFIAGSLIYSFLHVAMNLNSLTIILFWLFLAITLKLSQLENNLQSTPELNSE